MKRVFLGGTCNGSTWRDEMAIYLHDAGLDYFNPVLDDWDAEAQENELRKREACDFFLYTITAKKTGDYSIAEVVDDSNKRPDKTFMVLLRDDDGWNFLDGQWKSLTAVAVLVKKNGAQVFGDLKSAAVAMGRQAKR